MRAPRPGPEVVREHDSIESLVRHASNAILKGLMVELLSRNATTGEWVSLAFCTSSSELQSQLKQHPTTRGTRAVERPQPETAPLEALRTVEQLPGFLAGCDLIQRGFSVALILRGSSITTQPINDIAKLREHYSKTPNADVGIRLGRGFAALRFNRTEPAQRALAIFKQRGWISTDACFGSPTGPTVFVFRTTESYPTVSIIRGVSWLGSGVVEAPPSLDQEWICEGPFNGPHNDLAALLLNPTKRAEIRELIADPASTQSLPKNADLSAVDLLEHVLFDAPCPGRPSWDGPAAAGLPAVFIGPDEYRVGTSVLEAVARDGEVYRRGNMLVTVDAGEDLKGLRAKTNVELGPSINPLTSDGLRSLITRSVCLVRRNAKDGTIQRVHPPSWLAGNVMARGANNGLNAVPPLDGVRETPILRADGTVLNKPGYDADTAMLLLERGCYPSIPDSPTQNDAIASAELLKEAFYDFPFESEADRSAALASVLTFFARPAYAGPTPLFFVEANKAGTGKGLLVDAITQITLGRPVERQAPSEEEEEVRKRITSIMLSGAPVGFIDNIDSTFGGPSLDAVITAQVWTDRILGGNGMCTLQNRTVWICTGNNPEFRGDMSRRICRIRMVTPEQNPELRQNYKHERLIDWIKQVRPQLVRAALTILRAYQVAGQPKQSMRSWGSFEGWSDYVRSALVFANCVDPAPESWRLEEMTPQVSGERMLVMGLKELLQSEPSGRASASRILQKLQQNDRAVHGGSAQPQWEVFRGACEELFGLKPGQLPNARSLGRKLTRMRDTNIIGNVLRAENNSSLNMLEYYIVNAQTSDATENSSGANTVHTVPEEIPQTFGADDFGAAGDGYDEFPPMQDPRTQGPREAWKRVDDFVEELKTIEDEAPRVKCVETFVAEARSINRDTSEPCIERDPRSQCVVLSWSSRRDNRIDQDCAWSLSVRFDDVGQFDWEFMHESSRTHTGNSHPLDFPDDDLRTLLRRLSTIV